jgi:hypothetical protein
MLRDYDVFEKFPDSSVIWRACVPGRYEAQRKILELQEYSENEFFILDIQNEFLPPKVASGSPLKTKTVSSG